MTDKARRGRLPFLLLPMLLAGLLHAAGGPAWAQEGAVSAAPASAAGEPPPLPDSLGFRQALDLASETPHPDIAAAMARYDAAVAEESQVRAADDIRAGVEARAQWIEPAEISVDQRHNDSSAILYFRKQLYDFGRQRAGVRAAEAGRREQEWQLVDARHRHRITVASAYFDVLLADLAFMRDDEDMAMDYVRLDRAEERNDLGQVSDIELRERQFRYQQTRRLRYAGEALQQTTRARLAGLLNRPGQSVRTLLEPDLGDLGREPDGIESLYAEALVHNPTLLAQRARSHAARARLQAAEVSGRPTLDALLETGEYHRKNSSNNEVTAGLVLDIPLYAGSRVSAATAKHRAEAREQEALLQGAEIALRQQLLELRQEIAILRVQREAARAELEYRDLYLDRSRALYELEINTDLGDAMARYSEARLHAAEADYLLALAWSQLDAHMGREPFADYRPVLAPVDEGSP